MSTDEPTRCECEHDRADHHQSRACCRHVFCTCMTYRPISTAPSKEGAT